MAASNETPVSIRGINLVSGSELGEDTASEFVSLIIGQLDFLAGKGPDNWSEADRWLVRTTADDNTRNLLWLLNRGEPTLDVKTQRSVWRMVADTDKLKGGTSAVPESESMPELGAQGLRRALELVQSKAHEYRVEGRAGSILLEIGREGMRVFADLVTSLGGISVDGYLEGNLRHMAAWYERSANI